MEFSFTGHRETGAVFGLKPLQKLEKTMCLTFNNITSRCLITKQRSKTSPQENLSRMRGARKHEDGFQEPTIFTFLFQLEKPACKTVWRKTSKMLALMMVLQPV